MTDLATLHQQGRLTCPDCAGRKDHRALRCAPCKRIDARTFTPEKIRARLDRETTFGGPDDCWPWTGATTRGYGEVTLKGYRGQRTHHVHRLVYELDNGPIPAGGVVRHSCDNPPCRNPAHLLIGTHADNVHDMMVRGRGRGQFIRLDVCHRGHPLPENRRSRYGCRICKTNRQRELRALYGRPDRPTSQPTGNPGKPAAGRPSRIRAPRAVRLPADGTLFGMTSPLRSKGEALTPVPSPQAAGSLSASPVAPRGRHRLQGQAGR